MARSSRQETFVALREKFPFFTFEKQEYTLDEHGLHLRYTFNLADQHWFYPVLFIPRKSFFLPDQEIVPLLDPIVFNLGMIELISYWKAACSPRVIIKSFGLHPEQVDWWKKLYFKGLGEFIYLNSLDVTADDFMIIESSGLPVPGLEAVYHTKNDGILIPVGGGKDSAVTLELLGDYPGTLPLILNPRGASMETLLAKGIGTEQLVEIRRTIDPELLRLNEMGFLNGHTPFSAMLAFVTLLAAVVTGRRHIALSNESSANEATIEGTEINHQYSKSFEFESDFREYVARWITKEVNYFSFLRPLNELQIAALFSQFPVYHPVFRSCNAGSKTNSWCCHCAKCLFTCIILSPFLAEPELVRIFGKDLFNDPGLKLYFDQLTGIADEKPFDCVGTIREVNLALCATLQRYPSGNLPYLLDYYKTTTQFSFYSRIQMKDELSHILDEHHLMPDFLVKLRRSLHDLVN